MREACNILDYKRQLGRLRVKRWIRKEYGISADWIQLTKDRVQWLLFKNNSKLKRLHGAIAQKAVCQIHTRRHENMKSHTTVSFRYTKLSTS
jgi:hypothetical protein